MTTAKIAPSWWKAQRVIEGKTFTAFARTEKAAAIMVNMQIAQEKLDRQGTLNI